MKHIVLVCFFFCPLLLSSQHVDPVNRNASPATVKLLRFLYDIDDAHTLAGQHNDNYEMNRYFERARDIGGRSPALWGTDLAWSGDQDPGQKIVDEAIQKHRAGVLVTLMWHAGRPTDDAPFNRAESIQGDLTPAEWDELITPGTVLHARWRDQIDQVATYLKQLRDANVPVLWRPYHEMNGVWFWWGDKRGERGFSALWKLMFDRYVNFHQLDNLIWVWNAHAPRDIPGDEAHPYADYFPGADYVDVLAANVFNYDYEQKDYHELLALAGGKLIALGEVGELPKPEILAAQPKWAWVMVRSSWLETHNTLERVMTIYNHSETLTLDELDIFRK